MLKKWCVLALVGAVAFSLPAQTYTYKPFRIDFGLLSEWQFYKNSPNNYKTTFAIEPKLSLHKYLSVGFLATWGLYNNPLESAAKAVSAAGVEKTVRPQSSARSFISRYQATADIHFLNKYAFRPYIGLGMGIAKMRFLGDRNVYFTEGLLFTIGKNEDVRAFALSPRFGIDIWHFRFNFVYNAFFGASKDYTLKGWGNMFQKALNQEQLKINGASLNHWSFQILFYLGGGRKLWSVNRMAVLYKFRQSLPNQPLP